MAEGPFNCAAVAGPASPELPAVLFPATVVIVYDCAAHHAGANNAAAHVTKTMAPLLKLLWRTLVDSL